MLYGAGLACVDFAAAGKALAAGTPHLLAYLLFFVYEVFPAH